MYISNGPTQGFPTTVIVTSGDGIQWSSIRKTRITKVAPVFVANLAALGTQTYPYPNQCRIFLGDDMGSFLDFDIQEVVNQPTWVGGTQAQLNTAITDINNWL
jgi:hypothetical protein